jgi:hypothetical protein
MAIDQKCNLIQRNPLGSINQNIGLADTMTFQFYANSSKFSNHYFIDPWRIWIEISGSWNDGRLAAGGGFTNKTIGVMAAFTMIQEWILKNANGYEIERLERNHILMQILSNMYLTNADKEMKAYEGWQGLTPEQISRANGVQPAQSNSYPGLTAAYINTTTGAINPAYLTGSGLYPLDASNNQIVNQYFNPIKNNYATYTGGQNGNWNKEWATGPTEQGSAPRNVIAMMNVLAPQPYYQTGVSNAYTNSGGLFPTIGSQPGASYPTLGTPLRQGLENPYPEGFCSQIYFHFSVDNVQRCMTNGLPDTQAITTFSFSIPLPFASIGCMRKWEDYALVPDWMLDKATFDFEWNPLYAFCSWFGAIQQNRFPVITSCVMYYEVMEITDRALNDQIYNAVQAGTQWRTKTHYAAPPYNIAANQVQTTYQFNLGFDSLNKAIWAFNSTEYARSAAAKEIYFVSQNLTQYQFTVLYDKYPEMKIQGESGTNYGVVNNIQFLKQTYDAFDKLIGSSPDVSVYNKRNTALNYREFMPSQASTTGDTLQTGNAQLGYFFETRLDGAGPYAFSFEGLSTNGYCVCGIDTRDARPFEVTFATDTSTWAFPGNTSLLFWFEYDMICIWDGNELKQRGKA